MLADRFGYKLTLSLSAEQSQGEYIKGETAPNRSVAYRGAIPLYACFSLELSFSGKKKAEKEQLKYLSIYHRSRQRDLIYLIQTTDFARLKNQSVAEVRFRDNFSVTSILVVTAIFSVTENSSRAEFDSGFFSFQQPLHRLSAVPFSLRLGHSRL